jgi:ABC-type cobalamin/Fe3+-siderophores transport system ATPase subunit
MQLADPPPERVTLTVQHLKRVVHDRPVLQDISFAITTGEILFVRGPSGVGKSLLLRCLAHLDPIQARMSPLRPLRHHMQRHLGFPEHSTLLQQSETDDNHRTSLSQKVQRAPVARCGA